MNRVSDELIISKPIPNTDTCTWTLATRLGDMMCVAEEMFGPRDMSYTILGVEFFGQTPCIWYPNSGNGKHIVIRLSLQACNDPNRAYYQMAHECLHTLCPSGNTYSNNLEEGVACYFSWYYMDQHLGIKNQTPSEPNYLYALDLVSPILNSIPFFIRNLRDIQPYLSKVTISDLRRVNPNLDINTIHKLLRQFQ